MSAQTDWHCFTSSQPIRGRLLTRAERVPMIPLGFSSVLWTLSNGTDEEELPDLATSWLKSWSCSGIDIVA